MFWRAALLALAGARAATALAVVGWASSPVGLNETVLVLGGGFGGPGASVAVWPLSAGPTANVSAVAFQVTDSTLKFVVPTSLPADDAWAFSVTPSGGGAASAPTPLNAPEPWWCSGDLGEFASAGGFVRVFGLSLAAPSPRAVAIRRRLRELREAMTAHRAGTDDPAADDSALAAAAAELVALRAELPGAGLPNATLRLTPAAGGAPVYLAAFAANATAFSVVFPVPPSTPPGAYDVAVSSGLGGGASAFVALDSFKSPAEPHATGITILEPPAWPAGEFPVTLTTLPAPLPGAPTSDDALDAALSAAAAAGGGTVRLSRGYYYLSRPVRVPPRTRLVGAGMGLTGLVFAEDTTATAPYAYVCSSTSEYAAMGTRAPPQPAPPARDPLSTEGLSPSAWGLSDLAIFVSAFHNYIVSVDNTTDGFVMQRVRVRANAWFGLNGRGEDGSVTRGRSLNVSSWETLGAVLVINGRNFVVTDNDLYGSYNVITSQRQGALGPDSAYKCNEAGADDPDNNCHGANFGVVARNVIFNGGAGSVMNQWQHMVFEHNVQQGVSLMAMGQALGTADGGYAQHNFIADNTYQFVFGNDREVMTFDCAGGLYFGPLASVSPDELTLTLASDAWPAQSMEWGGFAGGSIAIVNGTGTGQYRRIVVPGVNATAAPSNRTWVIDSPFVPSPDASSIVQVLPFRGRNIWHRNTYKDSGSVQFYGHAMSNIVSETFGERFGGIIAWGQWRNWTSPEEGPPSSHSACGLGNGIQPNVQAQWLDNVVVEGLHLQVRRARRAPRRLLSAIAHLAPSLPCNRTTTATRRAGRAGPRAARTTTATTRT